MSHSRFTLSWIALGSLLLAGFAVHPNVGAIHGLGEDGDACFLVLELVPGANLAERFAKGRRKGSIAGYCTELYREQDLVICSASA